uniref:4-diphosphocytidyl-2-C-methyl-D-erythritol kinase n=1 Tax=Cyanothece sp. (strain PCC 7425 / ATCC 29141) TaxID=395961 RepID=ISPE_CYAP4|nr:RecName: Full=4-diphosphocytidyl-2-C-methyl-D-erythritol kinase; Short=CMK; AltName: Full=4-(cytidine-5'-diphospho)-2-C-methyl-D-erythritol kinase [Cyanothece sp. PCC 7425]
MRAYTLIAPAKINLFLQIIGDHLQQDQPTGYHNLVMVLQSVSLSDELQLRPLSGEARSLRLDPPILLHCDHPQVPLDQTNLVYRAAALMWQKFPGQAGVEITLHKRIPIGAGLAGGSTDAAAVLVGLNLMWELGLTQLELQELGSQLGADVPFCIRGGTSLAVGRGDQLSPLPDLEGIYVVLGKYHDLSVSTPWAYQTYRQQFQASYAQTLEEQEQRRQQGGSGALLKAIAHRDGGQIGQLLHNDLEKVVLPAYPRVEYLRQQFANQSPLGTMMSGSGPTVFALADSAAAAEEIYAGVRGAIADPYLDLWICQLCNQGIQVQPL